MKSDFNEQWTNIPSAKSVQVIRQQRRLRAMYKLIGRYYQSLQIKAYINNMREGQNV